MFYGPYSKYMPTKQSCLLTLFNDLGIPHEEQKQVFGSPLMIISFDVNPNSMTITMSPEACNNLIGTTRGFANTPHHKSLKDFQCLASWINWALNIFSFLRPGLSGVYEKM